MIRQTAWSLVAGFAGAMLWSMIQHVLPSATAAGNQVVQAQAFNLVDASGKLRAQLGFAKEGPPGLWLMDSRGTARFIVGLYADETPYLGLQDAKGQMIELMRTFGPKQSPLLIFKHEGEDMMIGGLNPTAEPAPFWMSYDKARKRTLHFGKYDGP